MYRNVLPMLWLLPLMNASMVGLAQDSQDERIELMRQRVLALRSVGNDDQLGFGKDPILRYSDTPRGIDDASLWRLGKTGRPRAVLVLEVYGGSSIQYELTAVADPPKQLQGDGWKWSPTETDFSWVKVSVELPHVETASLRESQLKNVSRNFAASEEHRGQQYHLRLMPQPLHVYEDNSKGVLSGAVFAWAHGTNVEILMFIELRQSQDSSLQCDAGFSRLASASLSVTYDGKPFWDSPSKLRPRPTDPYFFRMQRLNPQEQKVFASE